MSVNSGVKHMLHDPTVLAAKEKDNDDAAVCLQRNKVNHKASPTATCVQYLLTVTTLTKHFWDSSEHVATHCIKNVKMLCYIETHSLA